MPVQSLLVMTVSHLYHFQGTSRKAKELGPLVKVDGPPRLILQINMMTDCEQPILPGTVDEMTKSESMAEIENNVDNTLTEKSSGHKTRL